MRKVRNITVSVTPEIYRQARHLAVEHDSTISELVAYLLKNLPAALKRFNYPNGLAPAVDPAPSPAEPAIGPQLPTSCSPLPALTTPTPSPLPASASCFLLPVPCSLPLSCDTVPCPPTNAESETFSHSPDPGTAAVPLYRSS